MCGETSESLAQAYVGLDAIRTCAIVYHKSTPLTEDEDDGTNPEHDDIDVEEEEQVRKVPLVSRGAPRRHILPHPRAPCNEHYHENQLHQVRQKKHEAFPHHDRLQLRVAELERNGRARVGAAAPACHRDRDQVHADEKPPDSELLGTSDLGHAALIGVDKSPADPHHDDDK